MSWQATAWAKTTRGHRSHGCGRLLLVLADYHDVEKNIAWPSQATLGEDCEMPKRTIQWCLAVLEKQGFITTLQKGNQYQPTQYQLNFSVASSQLYEGAISGGASLAGSSEGARWDMVKAQDGASEGASPVSTSLQEPPVEPPRDDTPRWVEIFETDHRWQSPLNGYVKDIATSYPSLDLTMEANNCLHWLQTNSKGKARKTLMGTWNAWLKKALKDSQIPILAGQPRASPRASRADINTDYESFNRG